ncbi:MHS family MFS transporter [Nocardiopsis sp. EMB25]|uniref:MFS transporter n=1 Tax=Nocardiopsis sp. EMB25 TaxID=2835867 RepID=UPI0022846AB7|nr:MFS transporter [Nocardiopsis sp. EMB25]MCY9784246.1 MHS family MFS transporter [Nocardiopsis sp. EMB25]
MTSSAPPPVPPPAPRPGPGADPREIRRVALSSYIGTTVEMYDFLLYGTAAALVFGPLFFPDLDPLIGVIASFGTLAAGYVARPLGGIVFGHFGDRLGRKRMLLTTMILMGAASTLIGLLPTYERIGLAAPVILVALRVVQGVAVGGEWGGAALMTVEHAAPGSRGAWGGVTQMGAPTGAVLATLALALAGLLPDERFLAWGWRVPFLASVALIGVGLFVRLRISESPVFARSGSDAGSAPVPSGPARGRLPFVEVLLTRPRNLVLAVVAGIAPFAAQGVFTAFVISYAIGIGYDRSVALTAVVVSSTLAIALTPLYARLSDLVGRRPVYLGGALAVAVTAFPAFWLVNTGAVAGLIAGVVLAHAIALTAMYAPMAALLAEMFDTHLRYTGASVSYQSATVLGAGLSPMIAASVLTAAGGGTATHGVSWMLVAAGLASAVAIWFTGETGRRDLTDIDAR